MKNRPIRAGALACDALALVNPFLVCRLTWGQFSFFFCFLGYTLVQNSKSCSIRLFRIGLVGDAHQTRDVKQAQTAQTSRCADAWGVKCKQDMNKIIRSIDLNEPHRDALRQLALQQNRIPDQSRCRHRASPHSNCFPLTA